MLSLKVQSCEVLKIMLITFCATLFFASQFCTAEEGHPHHNDVRIVNYHSQNDGSGSYRFAYALSDGQERQEEGQLEHPHTEHEAIVVRGSYSYVGGDGVTYAVRYIADRNGFHPEGNHIKVPPLVGSRVLSATAPNADYLPSPHPSSIGAYPPNVHHGPVNIGYQAGPSYHAYSSTPSPNPSISSHNPVFSPGPVYASPTPLYSSPTPGYSSPTPGYSYPAPGYPSSTPGYSTPTPGYSSPTPGYSSPEYASPTPGYSSVAPGYSSPIPEYPSSTPGYSSSSTPGPLHSSPSSLGYPSGPSSFGGYSSPSSPTPSYTPKPTRRVRYSARKSSRSTSNFGSKVNSNLNNRTTEKLPALSSNTYLPSNADPPPSNSEVIVELPKNSEESINNTSEGKIAEQNRGNDPAIDVRLPTIISTPSGFSLATSTQKPFTQILPNYGGLIKKSPNPVYYPSKGVQPLPNYPLAISSSIAPEVSSTATVTTNPEVTSQNSISSSTPFLINEEISVKDPQVSDSVLDILGIDDNNGHSSRIKEINSLT